jgi:phosphatidylserine/phosphatidylglycerophosphate/cardiolipin synthase-like enzyme
MHYLNALWKHLLVRLSLPVVDLFARRRRRRPVAEHLPEPASRGAPGDPLGDSRWYPLDFPPRPHSALRPLVHGDTYFGDLCAELARARQRVTIAGWCLTPQMSLLRHDREGIATSIVADLLRETSERAEVYVLLWEGAPALFQPTAKTVRETRDLLLSLAPRVRCVLDGAAPFSHDEHQKAVTIDGRVGYVGGIDLTTYAGDRWDTSRHPLRFGPSWHDVQMRIEGEAVRDVEENFCQRWNATTGEHLEPLPSVVTEQMNTPVQVVRTIPRGFYPFAPEGIHGIVYAYLHAIARAERFIYLENQYLWSPEIVDALIAAMNRQHAGPFRIVIVLPAKAYTGKYDNDEHVRRLQEADAGRGIFAAYCPYSSGPALGPTGYHYLPVYVHAKVGIIDDAWLTVGSANLNRRGLGTDAEMNVQSIAPEVARNLRVHLWADHLHMKPSEVEREDPIAMIDTVWKKTADRVTEAIHSRSVPPGGSVAHYMPGKSPGSWILDGIQMLTLEH